MSRQNRELNVDPNVITLFADDDFSGAQKTYTVGSCPNDFTADGFTQGLTCIQIPAYTRVILYPGVGHAWNHSHDQYNIASYLAIYNGWSTPWQFNFMYNIGQFDSKVSGTFNPGYVFNDMFVSMQSYAGYDNGGHQYLEVQQRGIMGVGGDMGATLYDDGTGCNFLTHFNTSDSNFGPVHNDAARSIAVAFYYGADVFLNNNYDTELGSFAGSTDPNWFPIRIYNFTEEQNYAASSIKIWGGDFGMLPGTGL